MAVYNFNPKAVQCVYGGKLIQGWAPDAFIQVTRNADMYTLAVGADSTGTRIKSSNYSGRVTLTLQQTSPSNDDLNAIASADELTDNGAVEFYLKSGNFIATAVTMWVVKRPDVEFNQNSLSNHVWVLETEYLTLVSASG